jgi:hypothetical protein
MKLLHTNTYEDEEIIDTMTARHGDVFKKVICDSTLNKDYTNISNINKNITVTNKIKNYKRNRKNKFY